MQITWTMEEGGLWSSVCCPYCYSEQCSTVLPGSQLCTGLLPGGCAWSLACVSEHLSTCRHLPVSETSLLVPVSNGSCPPSEIQLRPSLGVASLLLSASPYLQPHTAKSPQTHPLPCLTVLFFFFFAMQPGAAEQGTPGQGSG